MKNESECSFFEKITRTRSNFLVLARQKMNREQWLEERTFLLQALAQARSELSIYKALLQAARPPPKKKMNFFKLPREILSLIYTLDDSYRTPFQTCLQEATSRVLYHKVFLPYLNAPLLKPFFVDIKDTKKISKTTFHTATLDRDHIHFSIEYVNSARRKQILGVAIFEENDPRLRRFMAMDYLRPNCIPDLLLTQKFNIDLHKASMMKKLYPTDQLVDMWNLKDPKIREEFLSMYQEFHNYSHFDNMRFGDISRHFYFRKMSECVRFLTPFGDYILVFVMDYSR